MSLSAMDKAKRRPGDRCLIVGNHPWKGHSGELVEVETFMGRPSLRIALDNGCSAGVLDPSHVLWLEEDSASRSPASPGPPPARV